MSGGYISARGVAGDLDLDADVCVIGSGAGGSTVATELALSGLRVVVLEEGARVDAALHGQMRPSESLRHVWRDGALTVALGVGDSPSINVTMAKVVGGSSMVTGGVCFRIPESVGQHWASELGLAEYHPRVMEPLFEHVEKAIHVEEVPAAMRSRSTQLFAEGMLKRGVELKPIRRNTKGCNGCGRCNFGCPEVAKLSVDVSYLPRAVAAGATVYSHTWVDRVTTAGGRVTGVTGRLLQGPRGEPRGRLRVRAGRVVLAAGAWHSPGVLMRSRLGHPRWVGRGMTLHPGFRVLGRFDAPVRGWQGALQSAYTDAFEDEGITLMGLFVPTGVLGATMPGVGREHLENAAKIGHLAMFGGIVHDKGGGSLHRIPGREPLALYRMDAEDKARIPRLLTLMAEAFFAAGAREVFLPVLGTRGMDADAFRRFDLSAVPGSRWESASQHPLGSARMGCSRENSVVDGEGRVWDVPGLYVADGSILPTSLGVNPQLAIMTTATRVAWRLRDRFRREA
ncbi:MAG: GMC family oxidoreductase [Myxococcales bacterium]|nr:GMC family oxidoreductase [Myxococcales bacterium]